MFFRKRLGTHRSPSRQFLEFRRSGVRGAVPYSATSNPLGEQSVFWQLPPLTIQQLLITEVSRQPEPLLREVWHYMNFLKAKAVDETTPVQAVRPGFGSVPGIELADGFDAPLVDFADCRP